MREPMLLKGAEDRPAIGGTDGLEQEGIARVRMRLSCPEASTTGKYAWKDGSATDPFPIRHSLASPPCPTRISAPTLCTRSPSASALNASPSSPWRRTWRTAHRRTGCRSTGSTFRGGKREGSAATALGGQRNETNGKKQQQVIMSIAVHLPAQLWAQFCSRERPTSDGSARNSPGSRSAVSRGHVSQQPPFASFRPRSNPRDRPP
ncbi:hypothetical protein DFJ74DRAFT_675000 [Hyaloraphidium curvatum]|nr:hypothetical protein DFJ74DRAFT_675000 [Hyaloraphidium curvatum]